MGANIHWQPVSTRSKTVNVGAPEAFQREMRGAGYALPTDLGDDDLSVLRGMAAVHGDLDPNPYRELIDLIETHGTIRVWAKY